MQSSRPGHNSIFVDGTGLIDRLYIRPLRYLRCYRSTGLAREYLDRLFRLVILLKDYSSGGDATTTMIFEYSDISLLWYMHRQIKFFLRQNMVGLI